MVPLTKLKAVPARYHDAVLKRELQTLLADERYMRPLPPGAACPLRGLACLLQAVHSTPAPAPWWQTLGVKQLGGYLEPALWAVLQTCYDVVL